MGSMDDSIKPHQQHTSLRTKLKIFLLLLLTNLLSVYFAVSYSSSSSSATSTINLSSPLSTTTSFMSLSWDSRSLLRQLNSTQSTLALTETHLATTHRRLVTTNSLLHTLLTELNNNSSKQRLTTSDLNLALGPHKLPFGFTPNIGSDELHPPLGAACLRFPDELQQYMTYKVGAECPPDDVFAQRLMLKGCEPLPRRRCHPKSPKNYVDPIPLPFSLWFTPPDTNVVWDPYTCKSYTCLINRVTNSKAGSHDCVDCFDLKGREAVRWTKDFTDIDYSIDTVLKMKPRGTVRIGLDIGGGSGTFAARMRERGNVTVVTSTMNFDAPFNSFVASRGLVPIHISIAHRLPFFENTLDIVHSMHVLSNWIPEKVLEFALYDIYRVLRPGGIFWLDRFFCVGAQLNGTYVPLFDRIGFNKLRWNEGRKLDRGVELNEWYISALLEKPMT